VGRGKKAKEFFGMCVYARATVLQSSKNEETLALIEYVTPDERGWSFERVLM
jgi:hypothetical protein